jgi:hypothetical protein
VLVLQVVLVLHVIWCCTIAAANGGALGAGAWC